MKITQILGTIIFHICIWFHISAYAAPFQNGSFEVGDTAFTDDFGADPEIDIDWQHSGDMKLTGWTLEILAGWAFDWVDFYGFGSSSEPPPDGTYYVQPAGTSGTRARLSQTFDTVIGVEYTVAFHIYGFEVGTDLDSADDSEIQWYIRENNGSGTILTSPLTIPVANRSWQEFSFSFTATTTTTYLSFENTTNDDIGSYIDNIRVTEAASTPPAFDTNNLAAYPYDLSALNLKAIPQQDMVMDVGVRNTGGEPDASSSASRTFDFVIEVPNYLAFQIGSVTFEDGYLPSNTPSTGNPTNAGNRISVGNSTMTCCASGDLEYSSSGKTGPWTHTPSTTFTDGGNSYDSNVRAIRVRPQGTFADGSSTATGFRVYYIGQIL